MALKDMPAHLPPISPAIVEQIDAPAPGFVPGAVAALPAPHDSDNRKDVGFLYTQLVAAEAVASGAVQKTGDTMTGMLDINLPASSGVIQQWRHQGITDAFVSTSGNFVVRGNLGVGPFADTPEHRYRFNEPEIESWFTNTENPKSGGRGIHINKISQVLPQDAPSHVVSFDVDDVPAWEIGVDFETQQGGAFNGTSDFVVAYDHSAGIIDDLSGADTGADILRISPAKHATTHGQGPKFLFDFKAGSPRTFPDFCTFNGGLGLGGVKIAFNHDVTKTALSMSQRSATHNRVAMTFANGNDAGPIWQIGMDLLAASRSSWGFGFRDDKTTSAKDNRIFIEGTDNLIGKIGFSTILPMATHHLLFSNAAGAFDTVQSHWLASFEDTGVDAAHHNRAINIQSILDAGTVKNYLWLSGSLGTTSTTTTPTVTSTGAGAFGLERTDTELSLATAAAGTNQTIVRGLRMGTAGQLGFFGGSPAAKPTVTGAKGSNAALASLLTALAGLGLLTDSSSA